MSKDFSELSPELLPETKTVEERLERLEEAYEQFQVKQKQVSRNTIVLTAVRYSLVLVLGGVGLIAAVLSGANYEQKVGDGSVSFKGSEFKGALQILAGFAASGTGLVGFGEHLVNAIKNKDDED
jgi:hypothetical protein